ARGPGLALLGLRMMAGGAAIAAGGAYVDGWSTLFSSRLAGLIVMLDGLLLVLGLLTPIAGVIAPLLACAVAFHWLLPPSPGFAKIVWLAIPFCVVTLSFLPLGPGPYSTDARFLGRKQPQTPPRTQS